MFIEYNALSMIYPAVKNVLAGDKKVEIRSWYPAVVPLLNLVLVENYCYLNDSDVDSNGRAVAIVDVISVSPWRYEDYIRQNDNTKLNKKWKDNYFMWHLDNIRPIVDTPKCLAIKGIYKVFLNKI